MYFLLVGLPLLALFGSALASAGIAEGITKNDPLEITFGINFLFVCAGTMIFGIVMGGMEWLKREIKK